MFVRVVTLFRVGTHAAESGGASKDMGASVAPSWTLEGGGLEVVTSETIEEGEDVGDEGRRIGVKGNGIVEI